MLPAQTKMAAVGGGPGGPRLLPLLCLGALLAGESPPDPGPTLRSRACLVLSPVSACAFLSNLGPRSPPAPACVSDPLPFSLSLRPGCGAECASVEALGAGAAAAELGGPLLALRTPSVFRELDRCALRPCMTPATASPSPVGLRTAPHHATRWRRVQGVPESGWGGRHSENALTILGSVPSRPPSPLAQVCVGATRWRGRST